MGAFFHEKFQCNHDETPAIFFDLVEDCLREYKFLDKMGTIACPRDHFVLKFNERVPQTSEKKIAGVEVVIP